MACKKITFSVPDWLYDGIKEFMSFRSSSNDYRIEDLFKACAINRMIQIGYLDEFGQPVPIPFFKPTSLKLPTWDDLNKTFTTESIPIGSGPRSTFSLESIREVTKSDK